MDRRPEKLTERSFDVLVAGGGIVGACAAWDASLRGLSVALVEREDFAAGTSGNSMKILHGGLRHLQEADLRRLRASSRERSFWLRAAPHLCEPIPFVVPLTGRGLERPAIARLGLRLYDVLTWSRNEGLDPERTIPSGRVLSPSEMPDGSHLLSGVQRPALQYHDGIVYNTERLVLEVILAAHRAGAVVANYAALEELDSFRDGQGRAVVRDRVAERRLNVRADVVLDATGPWAPASRFGHVASLPTRHCLALNVVTTRPAPSAALGLDARLEDPGTAGRSDGRRRLFMVPWRDQAMIGTGYFSLESEPGAGAGDPPTPEPGRLESAVRALLCQVNETFRTDPFTPEEVVHVHAGYLPLSESSGEGGAMKLREGDWVADRSGSETLPVIAAGTVKYTTGRRTAARAVRRACSELGRPAGPSPTRTASLPGTPTERIDELVKRAIRVYGDRFGASVIRHLVRTYGRRYEDVVAYLERTPGGDRRVVEETPVTRGEMAHVADREMAVRPEDVIYRRTEVGARGWSNPEAVRTAEAVLAGSFAPENGPRAPESG